jgi:hypothetical protein
MCKQTQPYSGIERDVKADYEWWTVNIVGGYKNQPNLKVFIALMFEENT